MSQAADRIRDKRQHWAAPGGWHDRKVRLLAVWLPGAVGVVLGGDLEEELPVLYLRVRRAALELGVPLVDLASVDLSSVYLVWVFLTSAARSGSRGRSWSGRRRP